MKKKLFSIILMIVIVALMAIPASALSFTATMTPSATTVQESTEFTITVKVSNLDVGTNGINLLSGYLKYDTEVFETISESSIEGLNSWSANFDATTGKISLTKNTFVTSTQEVFQITLKTKTGINGKSGTISYSNIIASNSESDISATDISTSIKIGSTEEGGEEETPANNTVSNATVNNTVTIAPNITANNVSNKVNTINAVTNNSVSLSTNNTANNSTNNTVSSYVNTMTNTTVDSETMPNTGVNDTILYLIFIVIAIAIVFYIKIEKLNIDMR